MPVLINSTIKFHTNDEDKDHDTHVTVTVRDSDNIVAARVDNDFGRFPDNSDNGSFGLVVQNPSSRERLQSGGVTIRIDPNGHDTWRFNFFLDLIFSDGSHLSGGSDGIELTQDRREQTFGLSGIVHVTEPAPIDAAKLLARLGSQAGGGSRRFGDASQLNGPQANTVAELEQMVGRLSIALEKAKTA